MNRKLYKSLMVTSGDGYRLAARNLYQNDDLEIDDNAELSPVFEKDLPQGAWVQAWVWVTKDDMQEAVENAADE